MNENSLIFIVSGCQNDNPRNNPGNRHGRLETSLQQEAEDPGRGWRVSTAAVPPPALTPTSGTKPWKPCCCRADVQTKSKLEE